MCSGSCDPGHLWKASTILREAGDISSMPTWSQSFIIGSARSLEALVCASIPGSGSMNRRIVMACRRRRLMAFSVNPVRCEMSAKETFPPGGTMAGMRNRDMAWRHARLLCYVYHVSVDYDRTRGKCYQGFWLASTVSTYTPMYFYQRQRVLQQIEQFRCCI